MFFVLWLTFPLWKKTDFVMKLVSTVGAFTVAADAAVAAAAVAY